MRSLVLIVAGLGIGFAPLGVASDVFPLGVAAINDPTVRIEQTDGVAVAAPVAAEAERPAAPRR